MRRSLAVPAAIAIALSLGGCYQGMNANTTVQGETTNGTKLEADSITIVAATVIAGNADTGKATVTAGIVNGDVMGDTDTLTRIEVDGIRATMEPRTVEILPGGRIQIGAEGDVIAEVRGMTAMPGEYVSISFTFAKSGTAVAETLVVPPAGYYLPDAPAGTTPEPTPTFDLPGTKEEGE